MMIEADLTRAEVVAQAKSLKDIGRRTPILQIFLHWLHILGAVGILY